MELWSTGEVEADLVEWGPWEGQSVEQQWQRRQATGASAGRWCSHWAVSGGSPELQCQENHGWGRDRGEGNPGWELDGEASSTPLWGKEEISVRAFSDKADINNIKFTEVLERDPEEKVSKIAKHWPTNED